MSVAKKSNRQRLLKIAAAVLGGAAVLYFLVGGGEYGTLDLIKQKSRFDKLEREVGELEARVDSLRAEYRAITSDKARLERIARERYGMVKGDKELLYYIIEDSAR